MELNRTAERKTAHLSLVAFIGFALGYLLSSQLRGVTAALAPLFGRDFGISAAEMGLLAGSYFASFALMQLPMGALLDRFGARIVLVVSLLVAGFACLLFAAARSFEGLFAARLLSGVGVSACLIAPLTAARLWTPPAEQQRLNSWMLMAGALGLVLGTLPSEQIASRYGWPLLFIGLGVGFIVTSVIVAFTAPGHQTQPRNEAPAFIAGYRSILKRMVTWRMGSLGFFNYAILVAVQTLWVGPWLTDLVGESARSAATHLMAINVLMLFVFLIMGQLSPRFNRSASDGQRLLTWLTPISIVVLALIAFLGPNAGWQLFALYCVAAWPLSVTHPLVGQLSTPNEAGRAIAMFNLLLFTGVFAWQWSFGLLVTYVSPALGVVGAYQAGMGLLAAFSLLGYALFVFGSLRDR